VADTFLEAADEGLHDPLLAYEEGRAVALRHHAWRISLFHPFWLLVVALLPRDTSLPTQRSFAAGVAAVEGAFALHATLGVATHLDHQQRAGIGQMRSERFLHTVAFITQVAALALLVAALCGAAWRTWRLPADGSGDRGGRLLGDLARAYAVYSAISVPGFILLAAANAAFASSAASTTLTALVAVDAAEGLAVAVLVSRGRQRLRARGGRLLQGLIARPEDQGGLGIIGPILELHPAAEELGDDSRALASAVVRGALAALRPAELTDEALARAARVIDLARYDRLNALGPAIDALVSRTAEETARPAAKQPVGSVPSSPAAQRHRRASLRGLNWTTFGGVAPSDRGSGGEKGPLWNRASSRSNVESPRGAPESLPALDAFVVHAPTAGFADAKAEALARWADAFEAREGRRPVVWLDAICYDLSVLPEEALGHALVYLIAAQTCVLLVGPVWGRSLECVALASAWRAARDGPRAVLAIGDSAADYDEDVASVDAFAAWRASHHAPGIAEALGKAVRSAPEAFVDETVRALLPEVTASAAEGKRRLAVAGDAAGLARKNGDRNTGVWRYA